MRIDPCQRWQIHPAVRRLAFRAYWPNLSTATQTQIAQTIAALMRRMQASPARPEGDWVVLISLNIADERLTTAHRTKLAYVYVRQSSVNQVRHSEQNCELIHH